MRYPKELQWTAHPLDIKVYRNLSTFGGITKISLLISYSFLYGIDWWFSKFFVKNLTKLYDFRCREGVGYKLVEEGANIRSFEKMELLE